MKGDRTVNNRERLLEVRRFFERYTDEANPKTLEDLLEYLSTIGDTSKLAKKSVKDDIQALNNSGFEVQDELEKNGLAKKYWHSARLFEIHELRMMVDAIVAAKFISEDVTEEIVEKLQMLTSIPEAKTLQSIIKTPKKKHGHIPYHIDRIQRAIHEQKAISFQYTDVVGFDVTKRTFPLRRDGERYVVNPIDLHWNHEQYYLIGIDESIGEVRNYRVDRIVNSEIVEDGTIRPKHHLPDDYYQKSFNMYNGSDEQIVLSVDERVLPVIFDKLGEDVSVSEHGERFLIRFDAAVSDGFIYWLLSLGAQVEVVEPFTLRNHMKATIEKMATTYEHTSIHSSIE